MAPHKSRFTAGLFAQTAVYWGTPTPDGQGGYTFADPIEIDCRWEGRQELIRDDVGRERQSSARVFVDRDLDQNGYLYKGTLDDLGSEEEADPGQVDDAFQIMMKGEIPDIKGTRPLRTIWLG